MSRAGSNAEKSVMMMMMFSVLALNFQKLWQEFRGTAHGIFQIHNRDDPPWLPRGARPRRWTRDDGGN
jgi:hypothetical protein